MLQRAVDYVVLWVFSVMYSCAVFLLKFRIKPAAGTVQQSRPQPQSV